MLIFSVTRENFIKFDSTNVGNYPTGKKGLFPMFQNDSLNIGPFTVNFEPKENFKGPPSSESTLRSFVFILNLFIV